MTPEIATSTRVSFSGSLIDGRIAALDEEVGRERFVGGRPSLLRVRRQRDRQERGKKHG
jgi:hypothetical protein